jgi:hypothetical protein
MIDIERKKVSRVLTDRFAIERNTFIRTVKDTQERLINIEIGDSKEDDFKPQVKTEWFDNEYNRSIRAEEHPDAIVKTEGDKIIYETPDYSVIQYEKPDAGEEGGHELEWLLPRKPASNELHFTLRYKGGVKFFHQPALTEKEKANGAERPENIIGSYAVYIDKANHRIGSNNYATGKIEHIYRPKAIDANGNEAWCILHIPESGGAEINIDCHVEVPQDFLDNAKYPVRVDPTFGYESAGGSVHWASFGSADFQVYGMRDTDLSGTLDSVSAYVGIQNGGTGTPGGARFADEEPDFNHNVLNTGNFASLTGIGPTLRTFTAASQPFSGTTVYVGHTGFYSGSGGGANSGVYYDSGSGTSYFVTGDSGSYSAETDRVSVYATYTEEAGTEVDDERAAETHGESTSNSERDVETHGVQTDATARAAEAMGSQNDSSQRAVKMTGVGGVNLTAVQDGANIALEWTY